MGADGTSTSTIVARITDASGQPVAAPSQITIALTLSGSACCTLTTATTVIPAGASDSASAPGRVTATTSAGSATITGTATGGYTGAVTSASVTTQALGQISLPPEVLVQPGGSVSFTVSLTSPAPAGGATVTLSTVNTAVATVTGSVQVAAGATQATATLTGGSTSGQTSISATSTNYTGTSTVATVKVVNISFNAVGGGPIGSVSVPATWTTQAQIQLSGAAPQGGLVVTISSADGTLAKVNGAATGSVAIAGGQLTSPAFNVDGVAAGQTTLTASAPGVTSASIPAYISAAPALSLNGDGAWVGAGMHRSFNVHLNAPAPPAGVSVTLSDTNPAAANPPVAQFTVTSGSQDFSYELDGIAVGTATLKATASGWADSNLITVNVANPTLYLYPGLSTPVTTLTTSNGSVYIQVQTPNCGACDTLNADTVIDFTVTASPAGILPVPPSITITKGNNWTGWLSVGQATAQGTYAITATTSGLPPYTLQSSGPSNTVTVTQPSISLSGDGATVGAGMHRNFHVHITNPATFPGLAVTVTPADATIANPASAQVMVPTGSQDVDYELDGLAAGSTTLKATATGWADSNLITVNVANPTLYLYPGLASPVSTLTASNGSIYVQIQTPACGACDVVTADTVINFTVTGSPAGIVPAPASVTITKGNNWTGWLGVGQATAQGTYSITASTTGLPPFTTITSGASNTVTVVQPSISLSGTGAFLGAGMHRNFHVHLSDPAPANGVNVTLAGFDPAIANPPVAQFTIAATTQDYDYELDGIAAGTTSLQATAVSWAPSNVITVNVANPTLNLYPGLSSPVSTLTTSNGSVYVQILTPNCGACDNLTAPATIDFSVASSPAGILPTPPSVVIPAGNNWTGWLGVGQATSPGTYSVTASTLSLPPGTLISSGPSNTVTVTQPRLTLNGDGAWVGAGMYRNFHVHLSDPAPGGGLLVNLAATSTTIAAVPSTITVPAGSQDVDYEVDGVAAGATTITAAANLWSGSSINVNVSNPTLNLYPGLSSPVTTYTVSNGSFYVQVVTPNCGACDSVLQPTQIDFTVSGTPGIISAPASYIIPKGTNWTGWLAAGQATVTGTYSITASTSSLAPFAPVSSNPTNTVTVVLPYITLSNNGAWLGAGMHRNFHVHLSDPAPAAMIVTLSGFDPAVATPTVTQLSLAAGAQDIDYELDGIAAGTTTLQATANTPWQPSNTITVNVANPVLSIYGPGSPITVATTSDSFYVQIQTPNCGACDVLNAGTSISFTILDAQGNPSTLVPVPPAAPVAAGQNWTGWLAVGQPTGAGAFYLRATASTLAGAPTVTSGLVTVNP